MKQTRKPPTAPGENKKETKRKRISQETIITQGESMIIKSTFSISIFEDRIWVSSRSHYICFMSVKLTRNPPTAPGGNKTKLRRKGSL